MSLERRAVVERQIAVCVRGGEVEREILGFTEGRERLDPFGGGSRGAADSQCCIDALDGSCRLGIQAHVLLLRTAPEDHEVGLVPDLEAPRSDLVDAVSVDEVPGECGDEVVPLAPLPWRRDDAAIREHRLIWIAGEGRGHERQFDDWTDPEGKDAVVLLVDLREIEVQAPITVACNDSVVIVQDCVSVDVPHTEIVVGHPERLLELGTDVVAMTVVTEGELLQPFRSDHVPHAVQACGDRSDIDSDRHRSWVADSTGRDNGVGPVPCGELGPRDRTDAVGVFDILDEPGVGKRTAGNGRHIASTVAEDVRRCSVT